MLEERSAVMADVHESRLRITQGEERLGLYQWNARIAEHYFCSTCGVYPFHRKRSMPDHYGVNLRCLDDFDMTGLPIRAAEGKACPSSIRARARRG